MREEKGWRMGRMRKAKAVLDLQAHAVQNPGSFMKAMEKGE
jgi:hypothetical protein